MTHILKTEIHFPPNLCLLSQFVNLRGMHPLMGPMDLRMPSVLGRRKRARRNSCSSSWFDYSALSRCHSIHGNGKFTYIPLFEILSGNLIVVSQTQTDWKVILMKGWFPNKFRQFLSELVFLVLKCMIHRVIERNFLIQWDGLFLLWLQIHE